MTLALFLGCCGYEVSKGHDSRDGGVDLSPVSAYLAIPVDARPVISSESFATTPLSRQAAEAMGEILADQLAEDMRDSELYREYVAKALTAGGETMKIDVQQFGAAPEGGHSLYISLHGGGATPPRFNDEQWENQILRLGDGYHRAFGEGIYVAPRGPTDTWDMWFQGHMDELIDRLIHAAILFEGVDPNRVYLIGYSAGGDGAFRLGPRMADRFAGVEMAAGHPGDAMPWNLRNVAFQMQGGRLDEAYDRHLEIPGFSSRLDELQREDPMGYVHRLVMWNSGHNFGDYYAVGWIAEHTRDPLPARVVWHQDGSDRRHFYWLTIEAGDARKNDLLTAEVSGNTFVIEASGYSALTLRLNDDLADLDEKISVTVNGDTRFEGRVAREGVTLWKTLHERFDRNYMFSAEIRLEGL